MKFAVIFLVAVIFHLLYINVEPTKLEHDKLVATNVDRQLISNLVLGNNTNKKGERTFDATFRLKQDLHPKNVALSIRTYIDRGNNKLITSPLKVSANVCDAFTKNQMNLRTIFDSSNITDCPIKAGSYFIHNWKPDNNAIPALPPGKYQADLIFVINSIECATMRWSGRVIL